MDVQVRDVMTQDDGIHMLDGNNLHEGAGRQRLERTHAFSLVGSQIREARDVPFGFDKEPAEVNHDRQRFRGNARSTDRA